MTIKLKQTNPEKIITFPYGKCITDDLDGYIFHGTDVPIGPIEDLKIRANESLDNEGAVYFCTQFDECKNVYGRYVIALPESLFVENFFYRNDDGNKQEKTSIKCPEDVYLNEDILVWVGKSWLSFQEFKKYAMDEWGKRI